MKKKMINKEILNYFIIVFYTLSLVFLMTDSNSLYGSMQDWVSQHSVIPDYFRNIFYETGNLVPNLAFNLGAGQNIYNFSYYGLLSPVFLISYLLPFINMTTYTIVSNVILYVLTGVLFYKFARSCNFDSKLSLFLSLIIVTLSPINYHFHHHIMFVNYMPFLILTLYGVNKYFDNGKSFWLVMGSFLTIMTSYYYSICSLMVIFIYGIYKFIIKYNKIIVRKILPFILRLIISILMSCVLLIPTLYSISSSEREISTGVNFIELIKPNFSELLYGNYTVGITALFVIAIVGIVLVKKIRKEDLFLVISVLLLTICPFVTYVLNGGLYIRGKVLIPFVLIYLVILGKFIDYLFHHKVKFKWLIVVNIFICFVMFIMGYGRITYYLVDLGLALVLLYIGLNSSRIVIFISSVVIILFGTVGTNSNEDYVNLEDYNEINNSSVIELINSINEDDFYRTVNINDSKYILNKVYNDNYYTTSMYSSVYNELYRDFYLSDFGNNVIYRNFLIQSGNDNKLFNNLMGVRYIISKDNISGYREISNNDDVKLYYNDDAYPVIYGSDDIGSSKFYKELSFPYNMEYMLDNTVVDIDINDQYDSSIYEYNSSIIKDSYEFLLSSNYEYFVRLSEKLEDKLLFIEFDMDYNQECDLGDQTISINGVVNKLTCSDWLYHNGNNKFRYVIYADSIERLDISIGAGKYKISNVKMYVMNYNIRDNYIEFDNLGIDKGKSTINGNIVMNNDGYIVTSIPYDNGFDIYVDGVKVENEVVNDAFLGFKVNQGSHNVLIKYNSPGYRLGLVLTGFGFCCFGLMVVLDNRRKKIAL